MRLIIFFLLLGCSSMNFNKSVDYVDLSRFDGDWYVQVVRPTIFEKEVHNGIEHYDFDGDKVKIKFTYNKGSFDGELKTITQKGEVYNKKTNSHWKVSPLWPFKFDFLVIALTDDYEWTAVGVPSGKYLWIMSRNPHPDKDRMTKFIEQVTETGYPMNDLEYIKHE